MENYSNTAQAPLGATSAESEKAVCLTHPAIAASSWCRQCKAPMCSTCAFELPGGIQLCPACISKDQQSLSPRRRKYMIWSYVMAVLNILLLSFFIIVSTMVDEATLETIASLMGFAILVCGFSGIGFGFSAIDKRLKNPVHLWVPTIGNLILTGSYLALCIIGLFMV